ncbi:MAG: DUF4277 domain-containing protein [Polyangiaceae bacterium]|nr:DUF4277 domain-containing protein [Polyangiaceae bacterium]
MRVVPTDGFARFYRKDHDCSKRSMYLRRSLVKKNGTTHTYWRLVRSVRRNGRVVQQTVAQLGNLDAQERAAAKELGARMTGGANQMELWEDNPLPQTLKIRADLVRLERSRDFGDVWLGWTLWKALQLDMLCASCMPEGKESVAWSTMAAVLVIARLCEPSSELHIAEDWYRKTALEDILDLPVERVNDDRLYRALDELFAAQKKPSRNICASDSANCSRLNMICCCTM